MPLKCVEVKSVDLDLMSAEDREHLAMSNVYDVQVSTHH